MRPTRKKPKMFPVIMPATMMSPPRIRGLPAARRTLDSSAPRSSARPMAPGSGAGGFCGSEGGIIIRMVGHLFDVLDVPDDVVFIQHENGPALDAQILDQSAIGFPKGPGAVIGQHLDSVHTECAAPALL